MFVDKFENQSKESQSVSLKKQWLETATKFLKGKPYQDLEWEFVEGLSVEPYYTKDEASTDFSYLEILQNNQIALNDPVSVPRFWYNQPIVLINSLEKEELEQSNKEARRVLMTGAEGIVFDLQNIDAEGFDNKCFEYLLFEVALPYCAISFQTDIKENQTLQDFSKAYIDYARDKGFDVSLLTGGIFYHQGLEVDEHSLKFFIDTDIKCRFHPVSLHLKNGDDEAQNIAEILFKVKSLVEKSNNGVLQNVQFVVEATDSFFLTTCKIRALRWLILQMYDLYGVDIQPHIHCMTSKGIDEKSQQDENWNLIRNTTQAFSCILGGTNALTVVTHQNEITEKNKIWANRIARNVSVMLREESFIDKTADPISGSYYCQQMTDKLIDAAWKAFQEMID
ncbi:methylmalonyl-CoA mutase family protein [Bernardetia sp.]|uniref:methylmalonyl-CoA mutase family protein n=1 Tax=Bernardetia sp. TaxID=1937974 RepID=UPI0025C4517B|nr:methylmalonyl-CoA mutase family protein [Bernardetia sp.]